MPRRVQENSQVLVNIFFSVADEYFNATFIHFYLKNVNLFFNKYKSKDKKRSINLLAKCTSEFGMCNTYRFLSKIKMHDKTEDPR